MASATAEPHVEQELNGASPVNGSASSAPHGAPGTKPDDARPAPDTDTEQFPPFEDADFTSSSAVQPADPPTPSAPQRPIITSTSLADAPEPPPSTAVAANQRGVTSPVTSPPYWTHGHGHARSISADSVLPPGAITLQDNEAAEEEEEERDGRRWGTSSSSGGAGGPHGNGNGGANGSAAAAGRDRNRACWAKSVGVTDYVVVNGSATNIGAFVVWNIRVETLSGSYMNIRKRYSEFDEFRHQLVRTFPGFEAAVPVLPPKSVISKFRPKFLEKRRAGLQYFLNCILLNPEFAGSPLLKDFLFS